MTLISNEKNLMAPVSKDIENLLTIGAKLKEYQEAYNNGVEKLKEFMEANSIKKFENEDIILTYIEPTYRESFDSKTFRAEHEDLYNEFVKVSPVKPSLRVTMRKK